MSHSKVMHPPGGRPAWLPVVLAAAAAMAWIVFLIGETTGHLLGATRFLLDDPGSYLYALGRWLAGEALYRDFAWQYGPLALGWYRAFAVIGGNTPLTLVVAASAAFAAAWMLTARLIVRVAGLGWGGFFAVAGLLPVMSASGPDLLNGPHGAIEMLLLAGSASILATNGEEPGQPWRLGLLAGLLQWVRFGPHLVALAAVLLVVAWQRGQRGLNGRDFVRQMGLFAGRLLAGYALVVFPLVVWVFIALPLPGAVAQLWPVHMVAHYAAFYPKQGLLVPSGMEFVLGWLPGLTGIVLALARLTAGSGWRAGQAGPARTGAVAGILFFPVYYLLGCAGLFRTIYPIIGHLWLLWPGVVLGIGLLPGRVRLLPFFLVIPAMIGAAAGHWISVQEEKFWRSQPVVMPNGQQLWFRAHETRQFQALLRILGSDPGKVKLAVFLSGGGIQHFFGTQHVGRHWWYLPEFVRPYEASQVLDDLLHCDLILVADRGQAASALQAGSGNLVLWIPLPRPISRQLEPHLRDPLILEGVGLMLRVQP